MSDERRRHPRIRPRPGEHLEVRVHVDGRTLQATVVDMSLGGLGLRIDSSTADVVLGDAVQLSLRLPGHPPLTLDGVARRLGVDDPTLLGVEYANLPADAERAIDDYVAARRREVGERGFNRYLRDERD